MSRHYSLGWKKVRKVLDKTLGHCYYCGAKLPPDTELLDDGGKVCVSIRNWHVDHATPLSRGGTHDLDNLVPSCCSCNMRKGRMTLDEFAGAYA